MAICRRWKNKIRTHSMRSSPASLVRAWFSDRWWKGQSKIGNSQRIIVQPQQRCGFRCDAKTHRQKKAMARSHHHLPQLHGVKFKSSNLRVVAVHLHLGSSPLRNHKIRKERDGIKHFLKRWTMQKDLFCIFIFLTFHVFFSTYYIFWCFFLSIMLLLLFF